MMSVWLRTYDTIHTNTHTFFTQLVKLCTTTVCVGESACESDERVREERGQDGECGQEKEKYCWEQLQKAVCTYDHSIHQIHK